MFVSTYEILINKTQFPKPKDLELDLSEEQKNILNDLSREVIQGYFLTISNLSTVDVGLNISFRTIELQSEDSPIRKNVAAVLDVNGINRLLEPVPNSESGVDSSVDYQIEIRANDTGLLIFQANPLRVFNAGEEFELRGYVDVTSNNQEEVDLLLTPEHRATFYKRNEGGEDDNPFVQLDQVAYALPTANGGSLFKIKMSE